MANSKNTAPIKLRETVPNPDGDEWPQIPESVSDMNVEVMRDRMELLFKRTIVPFTLANTQGNVKHTAETIAMLFIGFLHNFLAENVKEGEKKTYSRVAEATEKCLMFSSKQMQVVHTAQAMGLPQSIISAMLHSLESEGEAPEIKVFTLKPGQELPQELIDLLRGKGLNN